MSTTKKPGGANRWGGRKAQAWTRAVLATYGTSCWLKLPGCTGVATTGDHVVPRSVDPSLEFVVSNGRPACRTCNCRRGAGPAEHPEFVDNRAWFDSSNRSPRFDRETP